MLEKLTFLVGLPGSGKTTYMQKNPDWLGLDDVMEPAIPLLKKWEKIGIDNICFVDIYFCVDNNRKYAQNKIRTHFSDTKLEWIFWENDLEAAWNNVIKRDDNRKISRYFLQDLSSKYNPPLENILKIPR